MTMVMAVSWNSLITSENEAARGVSYLRYKRGVEPGPGGGERGKQLPLIGSAAALPKGFHESLAPGATFIRIPPHTSKTSWKVCRIFALLLDLLHLHFQHICRIKSSCFHATKSSHVWPGEKHKQLMSNTDPCVCVAACRRCQLFLKSPARRWCKFICKIMIGVLQTSNTWSEICF